MGVDAVKLQVADHVATGRRGIHRGLRLRNDAHDLHPVAGSEEVQRIVERPGGGLASIPSDGDAIGRLRSHAIARRTTSKGRPERITMFLRPRTKPLPVPRARILSQDQQVEVARKTCQLVVDVAVLGDPVDGSFESGS